MNIEQMIEEVNDPAVLAKIAELSLEKKLEINKWDKENKELFISKINEVELLQSGKKVSIKYDILYFTKNIIGQLRIVLVGNCGINFIDLNKFIDRANSLHVNMFGEQKLEILIERLP